MMEGFTPAVAFFPCYDKSQATKVLFSAAEKTKRHGSVRAEGFQRAIGKPFGRLRRGEIPAFREKPLVIGKNSYSVAPIWRDTAQMLERAAWGRFCGSAKLLAGTLRCLHLCWRLPWDWSDAEQLGRCPKPQQGRCPCTLQGTLSLDPFWRSGLSALPMLCPAEGFCPFLPFLIGTGT